MNGIFVTFFTIEEIRDRYARMNWSLIPDLGNQDKKSVMRILEQAIAQFAGALISELRVSEKFIALIDPIILTEAFPYLFGEFTDYRLFEYLKYLSEHTGECRSYPDIIRDIAPWVRQYE